MSEVNSNTVSNSIGAGSGSTSVRRAIATAARNTKVDFDFLLAQARVESDLDSGAKAPTSSAAGLFQFIEQTWLATVQRHGAKHGLAREAAAITLDAKGARITDPALRQQVLALRYDPQASAMMAGALAQDNRAALIPVLGREPDAPELYLAHFLGAGGARTFLGKMMENPDLSAVALFPKPAAANHNIFYTKGGEARSLAEVMGVLERKIESAMGRDTAPEIGTRWFQPANTTSAFTPSPSPSRSRSPSIEPTSGRQPKHFALPMTKVLESSFGGPGLTGGGGAPEHVRKAYATLKAFQL